MQRLLLHPTACAANAPGLRHSGCLAAYPYGRGIPVRDLPFIGKSVCFPTCFPEPWPISSARLVSADKSKKRFTTEQSRRAARTRPERAVQVHPTMGRAVLRTHAERVQKQNQYSEVPPSSLSPATVQALHGTSRAWAMRCSPAMSFNEKGESHEQISHTFIPFRHRRVGGGRRCGRHACERRRCHLRNGRCRQKREYGDFQARFGKL